MKVICKKCGSDRVYIETKQRFSEEREEWEVREIGEAKCEVCKDHCDYRYEPLTTSFTCFDCGKQVPCEDLGKYKFENEIALCDECLADRDWDKMVDGFKRL